MQGTLARKIQKGAPLAGSPVQLQSVLMTSSMTLFLTSVMTSLRRDVVIATSIQRHQTVQYDDIFMTSYCRNDVTNDVIRPGVQPMATAGPSVTDSLRQITLPICHGLPNTDSHVIMLLVGHLQSFVQIFNMSSV